ncbi:hypothetical protein P8C59_003019 [Phyllachora maydis]|uniref:Zn(2)-C6 fungal-type domain-containing protein n=1 Tax=Phyllachora maydis TaxID=1825666 RepID=A0AAD9I0L3_9PEZI|nr:hypothetical protein P8C59_003019 [Phyllachora maydis]
MSSGASTYLFRPEQPDSDDGKFSADDGEDDSLEGVVGLGVVANGKRKRLSVSCELCKQRKVKCNRGQPSCSWCTKNKAICEYRERKKPGLRAGYGRQLEWRLDRLEHTLRAHSEMLQAAFVPTSPASSGYSLAQPPASVSSPASSVHGAAPATARGRFADHDLPPYDLLYALADLYFKHINTWCPILHRKTTLDSLFGPAVLEQADKILLHAIVAATLRYSDDVWLTDERRQHYHHVSKQNVLLYGMEHSSVKALQALVILALDMCGSGNGPPGWNLMALITRAVVQLGLSAESTPVSPDCTSIYTLRAMMLPEAQDFVEEESRRRLFWMVYVLDRYATIATAFDFALDDREIDRTLPCRDDLWIRNSKVGTRCFRVDGLMTDYDTKNLGAFSYYIEILGILSSIHRFLRRPVDISALSAVEQWQMRYRELDQMLTTWKANLPGEYGNMAKLFQPPAAPDCGWVMLHATYHTATIRLHSSAAYPTTRSPIFTPSYSASQRCHAAVENLAALGALVAAQDLLTHLGPPFAFTLWVGARLLLVHGSTVEHRLSPQIARFVDTLRAMGRYWPVAARYCDLLDRVLDEHREAEGRGDGLTPSSVRILADMRCTAFDLDFLISRQPRHGTAATTATNTGDGQGGTAGAGGCVGEYHSKLSGVTPARTPQPNELEYLDVFDFFNYPRLPVGPVNMHRVARDATVGTGTGAVRPGEFNIIDFMVDVNHDWLPRCAGV